jgi:hypothetical protein
MSKNNNSDLNAKTNVVELTQAELDSVLGGMTVVPPYNFGDALRNAMGSL